MTEAVMVEGWREAAAAARSRRRAIWIWSPVFITLGGMSVLGGAASDVVWLRVAGVVCGGALALWGFLYGTSVYIREVDEQERDANLWGCYVGMCVYLFLFGLDRLLRVIGQPVPDADMGIFAITICTVLGVFAWKRFR